MARTIRIRIQGSGLNTKRIKGGQVSQRLAGTLSKRIATIKGSMWLRLR
jgi:hypothetical protein